MISQGSGLPVLKLGKSQANADEPVTLPWRRDRKNKEESHEPFGTSLHHSPSVAPGPDFFSPLKRKGTGFTNGGKRLIHPLQDSFSHASPPRFSVPPQCYNMRTAGMHQPVIVWR